VALGRLLERVDYSEVTAGAVAAEAGLAHGTFYRYFKDTQDALRAAVEQVREAVDRTALVADRPVGTLAEERERVRRWAEAAMRAPVDRPGLVRAWLAVSERDPAMAARKNERRLQTQAELSGYIERLIAAGLTRVPDAAGLASALLSLVHGTVRESAAGVPLTDGGVEGVLLVVDRAVFCA